MVVTSFPGFFGSISEQCISAVPSAEALWGRTQVGFTEFRRSIIDTYYRCLRKSTARNMFPPAEGLSGVSDEVRWGYGSLGGRGEAAGMGRVSGDHSILLWGVQCWAPSQWLAGYLRLALVFVWNGTRQEDFNFCFSGAFC